MLLFTLPLFTAVVAISAENFGDNITTKSTKVGFGSPWLPRSFRITCCLGGYPTPENPQMIRNWTHEESDYVIDERYNEHTIPENGNSASKISVSQKEMGTESNCRVYHGNYLLSAYALLYFDEFNGIGVVCKCPEVSGGESLDRNCRRLKPCLNNGYRSYSLNCICPEPYFGEQCEKYCDQGQRMKENMPFGEHFCQQSHFLLTKCPAAVICHCCFLDAQIIQSATAPKPKSADGRDYCGCVPFYQGEECRDMICLNGGTEVRRRCRCPSNYLGYHCEIDANRTSVVSRFHGYGEQGIYQDSDLFTRDVSGTIFSLVMIVVLVLSMYLLMKHRMQVQNRFATIRREAVTRSVIGISPRRGNMIMPDDPRIFSFRAIPFPNEGPPPYVAHPQRGRSRRRDHLPPLPSYEDATKLPPMVRPQVEEMVAEEEEVISNSPPSEVQVAETVSRSADHNEALSPALILQQSFEPSISLPSSGSVRMDIFTTDNSCKFNKNSPARKSI